jgi:hypothetical protein
VHSEVVGGNRACVAGHKSCAQAGIGRLLAHFARKYMRDKGKGPSVLLPRGCPGELLALNVASCRKLIFKTLTKLFDVGVVFVP